MYSPNNVDYLHSKGLDEQYNAIKYICNTSTLLQKFKGIDMLPVRYTKW